MNRKHPSERVAELSARLQARRPAPALIVAPRPRDPRRSDIREACILSHRKASQQGTLVGRRSPASLVGALLDCMSAESAMTLLEIATNHARRIVEDEKPLPLDEVLAEQDPRGSGPSLRTLRANPDSREQTGASSDRTNNEETNKP